VIHEQRSTDPMTIVSFSMSSSPNLHHDLSEVLSSLASDSETNFESFQSRLNDQAKEPFGRLTVLTDHDTRASEIRYTRETYFQKHIYSIACRYRDVMSYSAFMTL